MIEISARIGLRVVSPSKGFQIAPDPIRGAGNRSPIEGFGKTGVYHIQASSFVNPCIVQDRADAGTAITCFDPIGALVEVDRAAGEIVGRQLPCELIHSGGVNAFRKSAT